MPEHDLLPWPALPSQLKLSICLASTNYFPIRWMVHYSKGLAKVLFCQQQPHTLALTTAFLPVTLMIWFQSSTKRPEARP
jgi:hypothetical protein